MAVYLNTNKNLENYKELYNEEYFVDKSKIISLIKDTNNRLSNIVKLSVIDVFRDNYNDLTKKVYLNKMNDLN